MGLTQMTTSHSCYSPFAMRILTITRINKMKFFDIIPEQYRVRKPITVKQLGIKKVVVVRTRQNGGVV